LPKTSKPTSPPSPINSILSPFQKKALGESQLASTPKKAISGEGPIAEVLPVSKCGVEKNPFRYSKKCIVGFY